MAHVDIERFRTRPIITMLLIAMLVLGFLPATNTAAQGQRSLSIETHQCPPGYMGDQPEQHCFDNVAGAQFTVTVGDPATGDKTDLVTNENGGAWMYLPDDVAAVHVQGPPFYISTTGSEPRPILSVRCLDQDLHEVAGSGGNPGTTYTIDDLQGVRALICSWYIGADTGAVSPWQGGYGDNVPGVYPGDFVSIYGANSDYPSASLTFDGSAVPQDGAAIEITGLDDELEQHEEIEATLNGTVIYSGPSQFPNWYPGMQEPGTMCIQLPAAALVDGHNTLTISNLEPDANFGTPPYILLGETRLVDAADNACG